LLAGGPPLAARRLLAAGALLGLSIGVRPDVLLPAGLAVAYLLLRSPGLPWPRRARQCLLVAAGAAAVVLPILIRNGAVVGQLIPVSSNAGINFYVGNAAGSDGASAVPVGLRWERLVARVPQRVLERPADASRWWRQAAWGEMAAAPGAALRRLGRKALAFWNRREFRNNVGYHFMQSRAWPLGLWPLQWATVLPLAACGVVALVRGASRRRGGARAAVLCLLWAGGHWAVGTAFFVTARFRLPAVPFLLLLAACGLAWLAEAARRRQWRTLGIGVAALLAAGAIVWPPWLGAADAGSVRDYVNLGNALQEARDLRGADRAYRQALAADPHDPDAHYRLARLLASAAPGRAIEHLDAARSVLPDSPDVLLALAELHRATAAPGRARQALGELLRVAATSNLWPRRSAWATAHVHLADLDPATADAHWKQAWRIHPATAAEAAFLRRSQLPRALDTLRAEAADKPWDGYAQGNLGLALLDTGKAAEAIAPLRRAARLAPERHVLRIHLARALAQSGREREAAPILDRLLRELPPGPQRQQVERLRR
ncbi:tetratricopeptide repeat protein, partial [bacterium]|nr:tetratricopeptide repeat protein [bacterium]